MFTVDGEWGFGMKRLYIHFINHLLPPVYNVVNGLNTTVNYRHVTPLLSLTPLPRDATSGPSARQCTAYFYEYVQLAPAD